MKKTEVATKGLAAIYWGGLGSLLRILLQLVAQISLARIVGPAEYGLFATAMITLAVTNVLSDIGLAYGLIQKPQVGEQDIRFVFGCQVLLGCLATLGMFVAAEPLSIFFGNPELTEIVRAMSIASLINAVSAPSMNLLKRNMQFKSLQIANVAGYFTGYLVVGLGMALWGFGVWALVAAFIVNSLVSLVVMYGIVRHPVGICLWPKDAREMVRYGGAVLTTNIINWLITSIDRVVVGRLFSTTPVAFYSNAYNLVSTPAQTLAGVLQPALFSASAQQGVEVRQLQKALLASVSVTTALIAPAFVCIGLVAETLIQALYGSAWMGSAPLLQPIAFAMPLLVLFSLATPSLWVAGQVKREFSLQLPLAMVGVLAFWIAGNFSLQAVAWTLFGMFVLRAFIVVVAASASLQIEFKSLVGAFSGGGLVCLLTGGATLLADIGLHTTGLQAPARLLLDAGCGAITLCSALAVCPGLLHESVIRLLAKIAARMPWTLRQLLERLISRAGC